MNKPSEQIKAMTQKLFKARVGTLLVKKLHPKRDWMIGILIGFCITAAVSTWSAYVYVVNRDGGTAETEVAVSNPSYQAVLVDQALKIFEVRSENFRLNGTATVIPVEDVVSSTTASTTSNTESQENEMNSVLENETNQEAIIVEESELIEEESDLRAPTINQ